MRLGAFVRGGVASLTAAFGVGLANGQPPVTPAGATTPAGNTKIAATVNGEPIRLDDVDAFIKAKLTATPLPAPQLRQIRLEVVSDLIDEVVLRQFLRKNGPKVEPIELDQHLKALTESLTKQNKTLADFYRESGQTEAQVREMWTTMIQLNKYVKERVTDDQLRAYHVANKEFFDRVEVKVSHILVRVGKDAPPGEKTAARQKLLALRADILAWKVDFAAAARKHSQCPSALQGGDLGYILRKAMLVDEAFCKVAFGLKVGEISDVIEGEYGLHLILAADRKPGTPSVFEKCIEDVRDTFADDYRVGLVAELRKQGQIQITVP